MKPWLPAATAVANSTVTTSNVSGMQITSVTADRPRDDILLGVSTNIW